MDFQTWTLPLNSARFSACDAVNQLKVTVSANFLRKAEDLSTHKQLWSWHAWGLTVDGDDASDERLGAKFNGTSLIAGEIRRHSDVLDECGAELKRETERPPDSQLSDAVATSLLQRQLSMIVTQSDQPRLLRYLHATSQVKSSQVVFINIKIQNNKIVTIIQWK